MNKEDNKLELLSVVMYMLNKWCLFEAMDLFGDRRGAEIFVQYMNSRRCNMEFVCTILNPEEYAKFVNRACSLYHGRTKFTD